MSESVASTAAGHKTSKTDQSCRAWGWDRGTGDGVVVTVVTVVGTASLTKDPVKAEGSVGAKFTWRGAADAVTVTRCNPRRRRRNNLKVCDLGHRV